MGDAPPQGRGAGELNVEQLIAEFRAVNERQAAEIERQGAQIAVLRAENAELRRQLGMNSSNSHKPPSSDAPGTQRKQKPSRTLKTKQRKGRKGHQGHHRALAPSEQCDLVLHHYPLTCAHCVSVGQFRCDEQGLAIDARPVWRHQVLDALPREHFEHQCHALRCRSCKRVTRAQLPVEASRYAFGPRLHGFVVALTGRFHLSKRDVVELLAMMSVPISLGAVSSIEARMTSALEQPVAQAHRAASEARFVNADETSWLQGHEKCWLWVAVSAAATVFIIDPERSGRAAAALLGGVAFAGFLGSDRWKAYDFIDESLRQLCWSHLYRDFVAMSQCASPRTAALGLILVMQTEAMFADWAEMVRDGPEPDLGRFAQRVSSTYRPRINDVLAAIIWLGEDKKSCGTARDLQQREASLWTFAYVEGLQPTNNSAERALRRGVLWRKRSLGTQSCRGSAFVSRILTVVETLRQQGRCLLKYLTSVADSWLQGQTALPSLVA